MMNEKSTKQTSFHGRCQYAPGRITLLVLFSVFLSFPAGAQVSALSDIFPLRLGNTWVYDLYEESRGMHSWEVNFGRAYSQIIGVTETTGARIWWFRVWKTYEKKSDLPVFTTTVTESLSGNHRLTSPQVSREAFYSIPVCQLPYLFRYSVADSLGNFAYVAPWSAQCPEYPTNFQCKADTGVTVAVFNNSISFWSKYSLVSFEPGHGDPRLTGPREVSLHAFAGWPKDTTLYFSNSGTDSLRIEGIETSDRALTATVSSTTTPFLGQLALNLRFTDPVAGNRRIGVLLWSNAVTSPDTIMVTITNVYTGIASLSTSQIDLPDFDILWRHIEGKATLTNTGNAALRLDSVTTTNPEFGLLLDMSDLASGARRDFQTHYVPAVKPWDRFYDTIYIHSSSPYSPNMIRVSARAYGGTFVTDRKSIEFGSVTVGAPAEDTIHFRKLGTALIGFLRSIVSGAAFSGSKWLDTMRTEFTTIDDVVRFAPSVTGEFRGYAVYSTLSGPDVAPDTVWLHGTGVAPSGKLTLDRSAVDFPDWNLLSGQEESPVTVTNSGANHLRFDSVAVSLSDIHLEIDASLLPPGGEPDRFDSLHADPLRRGPGRGSGRDPLHIIHIAGYHQGVGAGPRSEIRRGPERHRLRRTRSGGVRRDAHSLPETRHFEDQTPSERTYGWPVRRAIGVRPLL